MKKSLYRSFVIASILILFCFATCKKQNPPSTENPPLTGNTALTITLYNKPLDTIQSYIRGRWKCHYGKGGIAANMVQYYNNYYWTFTSNNRVEQTYNGIVVTDTTIKWIRARGSYTNSDSTFIMSFYDKQNVPWVYVVDGFVNDTLVLHNNYADAVFYHFTKF